MKTKEKSRAKFITEKNPRRINIYYVNCINIYLCFFINICQIFFEFLFAYLVLNGCYFVVLIVIVCVPVAINGIESVLAKFQVNVIEANSSSLDMSIDEALEYYADEYVKNEGGKTKFDIPFLGETIWNVYTAFTQTIWLFFLYLSKYLFYLFSAGRYIYLMLLQIVSPIAIVLLLSEKTSMFFFQWLKHFIICYMMIPAFILSNTFAEEFVQLMFPGGDAMVMNINAFGPVGIMLVAGLKFYLFSFSQRQLFNLL